MSQARGTRGQALRRVAIAAYAVRRNVRERALTAPARVG
jgi:hypothetical protein